MNLANLILEHDEHVAIVTVNRPGKLNALNAATISELDMVMRRLAADDGTRAIILTGAGDRAFVAGADISEISALSREKGAEFARRGQAVFRFIEKMDKPVTAAVNGFALGGGCELAMACHFRVASSSAKFGQPEINLGIIPGYGGTQRLPRLIGRARALKLLTTGEMIDAAQALEWGLVSGVLDSESLMGEVKKFAQTLAAKAPLALKYIIEAVDAGMETDLDSALDIEADLFGKSCATEDMREGTSAFLEKRAPQFKGK